MGLKVLRLTAGDPHGKDKLENYAFEAETVEGALEDALRREIACWALVCDREEVHDHDEYGKDSESTLHRVMPIAEADGDFIVFGGKLIGFKHGEVIFFLPNGNYVGTAQRTLWTECTSREYNYEVEEFRVAKIAPSPLTAYYEEKDGNAYHTLTAFDSKAKKVEVHPDTKHILAPNVEFQYATSILERQCVKCLDLTSVSIPAGVEKIDDGVFLGCKKLESITVDEENPTYRAEGNCLINKKEKVLVAGCAKSVLPNDGSIEQIADEAFAFSGIKHVVVPEGVKRLGTHAFLASGIDSIVIPKSLEAIGYSVFTYCYFTIYYAGTESEFAEIKQGRYGSDEYWYKAQRYFYSEEAPAAEGKFWHYGENGEILVW